MTRIEKQIRGGLPLVGVPPYGQIHAHSTGNRNSTAQNEADYMNRKDINSGFYTHVVGNGRIIQVANTNRGAWDVGGGWNQWGYASVELIESHSNYNDFYRDYTIYVNLLRDLAKEAGIRLTLDTGELGIMTHYYCTYNQPYNNSDHVDPYPYLQKWGISKAQFKKDVENGISGSKPTQPTAPSKPASNAKTVTIAKHASAYSKSSKYAKIANWVKGGTFKVLEERAISQSNSNREYLIAGKDGKTPIGWVLSQDIVGGYGSDKVGKPATKPASNNGKWIAENGKYYPDTATNLRTGASTSAGLIATIGAGQEIKYDAFMNDGKYIWIRQPRGNSYGYMATGNVKNGQRSDYWGKFR